jgi:SAM-dependent methyltransferase
MGSEAASLPCRLCGQPLEHTFADLGTAPPANGFRRPKDRGKAERRFPLHARVCGECRLVQLDVFQPPEEIFTDYVYFSSYSDTWRAHAGDYAEKMIARLGLGAAHQVVELASNDGYLLRHFKAAGIPVLGVEPAANVARVAMDEHGIPTLVRFFGEAAARDMMADGQSADLLTANNVLAHIPDLHDFVEGMRLVLAADGVATIEFPHLLRLIAGKQFDTIYHEHFSYFSLATARRALEAHGLRVFHVEELPTHGGSLRLFACHQGGPYPTEETVEALIAAERAAGLEDLDTYRAFDAAVKTAKRQLPDFLADVRDRGVSIAGYGAPAKGNTLLNYCGVGPELLPYTVDVSPHKQGLLMPGSGIPVHAPEHLRQTRPDYVLVLPWNLIDEITHQMADVREWGGRFVVPIPEVRILS